MDGIAPKWVFPKYIIWKDDLGISKVMKISLPNLNDMDFRLLESTEKKIGGSGITPSYFPALTNMTIFGHFSLYRDKG